LLRSTVSAQQGKSTTSRNLEVQRLLELLGFDAGVADGAIGPSTRAAIVAFKRRVKQPETDVVDDELVAALHREWALLGEISMKNQVGRRLKTEATGTGFFVSKQGHLLTNNHVISGCESVTVRWPDKREVQARVAGRSPDDDLAVLIVDTEPQDVALFRPNGQARLGETIVVYGFPLPDLLSSSGNLTTGAVTALAGLRDESRIMQISAPVQAGNSGGR
jgi:S1-C subfamily serine protease